MNDNMESKLWLTENSRDANRLQLLDQFAMVTRIFRDITV